MCAEGGGEGEEAVEGGEGGATQEEAAEGGAAVETAWAPQDTEGLLDAIATQDYGVSDDRSSKLTAPALRAYNKALKSEYGHYELRRGRTLPEGFTIVKVNAQSRPQTSFTFTPHQPNHRAVAPAFGDLTRLGRDCNLAT